MSFKLNDIVYTEDKAKSRELPLPIICSPCLPDPVFADREMVYWGKSDGMGGDGNVIGSTLGTITTTATMR